MQADVPVGGTAAQTGFCLQSKGAAAFIKPRVLFQIDSSWQETDQEKLLTSPAPHPNHNPEPQNQLHGYKSNIHIAVWLTAALHSQK